MKYEATSSNDLVIACLQPGNEAAWAEFVRRFHPLIASVVYRTARQWGEATPQAMDDLVQETYLKICAERLRLFGNFKSHHPDAIYGFIKVFTANLVHDHFKTSHAQKRGGAMERTSLDFNAPQCNVIHEESGVAASERKVLLDQVTSCLEAVVSGPNARRDCQIFWLYYRVGLSARAIAALPTIELTTKGVESIILRLTRLLRQQLGSYQSDRQKPMDSSKGIGTENSF